MFTGLQPSGTLHLGNYFGVLRPFVEMYEKYESFLMVADYHALTTLRNPDELRKNIYDIVRSYVAAGVDPKKAVIFQQSRVHEHTELAWIFECLVTVPFLGLSHAYKDKVAKGLEANAGLFNYPMLMAADILLYETDVVPVGADQQQHIEYAREAAAKFNNAYGHTFKEPQGLISKAIATIPGTDGMKMSKSYGNAIPLFGSNDEIARAVMSIITDSTGEMPENVYAIHRFFQAKDKLDSLYANNKGNYKALKEALIQDIETVVGPMRETYRSITDADVNAILAEGSSRAQEHASAKMLDVRRIIGVAI